MTRMKIRDRENRKILTGFRDMADSSTVNRDPIPLLVGPQFWTFKDIFSTINESKDVQIVHFLKPEWLNLI